jgi:signal transduction histidine kinase
VERQFDSQFAKIIETVTGYLVTEVRSTRETAQKKTVIIKSISWALIALAFAFASLLSLAVTRSIMVPIAKLKKAAGEIGRGNLDIELDIQSPDEIGELAVTFRRMAVDLKRYKQQLEEQVIELTSLNHELEAFSYSVSHDLRAPLTNIQAFSKALHEDYSSRLDTMGNDYLQRLMDVSRHMEQLIDDMLALSRLTQGGIQRQEIDLSPLAEEIARDLQKKKPERQVEFVIQRILRAHADERLMRAVLENLIGNAWKFTSQHAKARIEIGAFSGDDKKMIYFVRDDGAGFDMKYAKKMFNPFQRLHKASDFPGTGIGLASVQRIIHRHGGRIWAEGVVDGGATFYFTL